MSNLNHVELDRRYVQGAEPIRFMATIDDRWSELRPERPVAVHVKAGQIYEGWLSRYGQVWFRCPHGSICEVHHAGYRLLSPLENLATAAE